MALMHFAATTNYLHLFSGANQGVFDNTPPASPFNTSNLGAALISAGRTFGGYSEDLPAVGSLIAINGSYWRKHNPWSDWQADPPGPNQLPPAVNMPYTLFPADYNNLPAVSFVVPNQQNDMHDGTIAQADAWLQNNLGAYATWTLTHNSLLIVTWDEDNSASRNQIATIFYGPMVAQGQNPSVWTLHNLLRTIEDMHALPHSGSAASVRPITGVFTTDVPTATRTFQQGTAGYADAHDTWIEQTNPNNAHGGDAPIVVDGSPLSQGLVRFNNIIGAAPSQIPPQTTIVSAKLLLYTGSTTGDQSVDMTPAHRMKIDWNEASTWNSLAAGVSPDDIEAATASDFALIPNVLAAWAIFDVTTSIQAFSSGKETNYGWLINPGGIDGWRSASVETAILGNRPILSVTIDLSSCRAVVSQQPASRHIEAGQALTLSVTAMATTPLTYQWRKNLAPLSDGGTLSGATSATLTIDPAATGDTGSYDVLVTSNCGPVTSATAAATVCPGPVTGDMDANGAADARDIGPFIAAVLAGSSSPADLCAGDYNASAVMDSGDLGPFASALAN